MGNCTFYTAGSTRALDYACALLQQWGWKYDENAENLILPVPSFTPGGTIQGGGEIRSFLSPETVVFGGNLEHPALIHNRCFDLLKDPYYLAQNARITAHCALSYALKKLPVIFPDCCTLIVGFGRIGKSLADILQKLGADVTVYARKPQDRALAGMLGNRVTDTLDDLTRFRVIFNTAPAMLIPESKLTKQQVKVDLASVQGIGGSDVIRARGLPGKDAPESSGMLIAQSVIRLAKENEI